VIRGSNLPALRPIDHKNLGQLAYTELREALACGRFGPGQRLKLRDLSAGLGISVTPVREAVLQLVREGALHLRSPRDIRVRALTADEFLEAVEIRKYLESEAIGRFVSLMSTHQLAEIEDLESKHEAALERRDYHTAIALDRRLMFTIFKTADLPLYLEIIDRLWLLARPTVTLLYSDEGAAQVDLGNGDLLTALREGDTEAAKESRQRSLDEWAAVIVELLDEHARVAAAAD
jgi:DNA-binding GntR family transcriptional regulator